MSTPNQYYTSSNISDFSPISLPSPWQNGRASDFGSVGQIDGGPLGGPGQNFFSHFLLRNYAKRLLVATIYTMNAVANFYTQNCAQKLRFIDLQLLRTTEILSLSIIFHFTLLSHSTGVKHSVK